MPTKSLPPAPIAAVKEPPTELAALTAAYAEVDEAFRTAEAQREALRLQILDALGSTQTEGSFTTDTHSFRRQRKPSKLVIEVPPDELPQRFRIVKPDVAKLRQAINLEYDVSAHLVESEDFMLVVNPV